MRPWHQDNTGIFSWQNWSSPFLSQSRAMVAQD